METVTNVAPNRRDPSFIAWFCPSCNAVDSELVYSPEQAPTACQASRFSRSLRLPGVHFYLWLTLCGPE
jgi:hypothetical protein